MNPRHHRPSSSGASNYSVGACSFLPTGPVLVASLHCDPRRHCPSRCRLSQRRPPDQELGLEHLVLAHLRLPHRRSRRCSRCHSRCCRPRRCPHRLHRCSRLLLMLPSNCRQRRCSRRLHRCSLPLPPPLPSPPPVPPPVLPPKPNRCLGLRCSLRRSPVVQNRP